MSARLTDHCFAIAIALSSGYFRRSLDILPKRGKELPWRAELEDTVDRLATLKGPIEDGVFEFTKSETYQPELPALEQALAP